MTVTTNAQGRDRKQLVQTIAKWLNEPIQYAGAPTFNYEVGGVTINKDAELAFDASFSDEAIEGLLLHLNNEGYDIIRFFGSEDASADEENAFCISMPRTLFTEEALTNLSSILASKGGLICKALGVNDIPVVETDEKVSFPWFDEVLTPEEQEACELFICKLCDMARTQKRITAKEKDVDNEKYAFRCFLLRLGFIGEEYKTARKILLRNLSGNSAFKSGQSKEDTQCE